jgi:hypothetical protein
MLPIEYFARALLWGTRLLDKVVLMSFVFRALEPAVKLLQVYNHMRALLDPYWWTVGSASLVQFILFLRWLYRRIRNDETTRAFVEDMATNHLPHIYGVLQRICEQKGIEHGPLPPIRWVDWNSN